MTSRVYPTNMRCLRPTILLLIGVSPLFSASRYTIEAKRLPDHTPLIPVRVNDSGPFQCQFDSGGSTTLVLDSEVAARAGLRPNGTGRSAGAGPGVVADQRLSDAILAVGDLHISDPTIAIFALGTGVPYECIFGAGILISFVVQVDYAVPAIRLYETGSFQPGTRAVSVPIALEYGNPVVSVRLALQPGQTVDAKLLVDTAVGQWPVALNKTFSDAESILTRIRKTVEPPFQAGGTGGAIGLLAARADAISVAEFTVPSPVTMLFRTESGVNLPSDGNLGSEFFRRFLLTIDYPNRRLFLKPNDSFAAPPSPYDGSGLWVCGSPGKFTIARVVPDSPAAIAGLESGDALVSVDGIAASDLTIFQIRERLYRASGRCTFRVRRGASELSVTLDLKAYL
jgi:hypothetical protein